MRLYLMRHGIAVDRAEPNCPADPDRPLTKLGVERTREAAIGLARLGAKPAVFLSSPYLRALQTAEIAAEAFGFSARKIRRSNALLPQAEPRELFRELADLTVAEVICFGHAPHLNEAVAWALGSKQLLTQLKKAGVAVLELERVAPPRGVLFALFPAKVLRKLAG
ncbi:MAG: histidine phosphatase family protein [Firmicutes bacterium]|nr:histidine phosphatase family protein [Bacillota bacterium]